MRKGWALMLEDVRMSVTGRAVVRAAEWRRDSWLYPPDWSAQLKHMNTFFGPFDAYGIPLHVVGGRPHYNPSRIAGYALALWDHREHAPEWRTSFLTCAEWFRRCSEARFSYEFDAGGMRAPWLSCVGQGQGISVLTRAFLETGEGSYLEHARHAAVPLGEQVETGGLLDRLPDGSPFLEEYPGCYPHVLNGCLHALTGLLDLARAAGEPPPPLFAEVLDGTARNIAGWEVGGWSTYDLHPPGRAPNVATLNYHVLHCIFLAYLAEQGDDDRLAETAARWQESACQLGRRLRALFGKLRYRVGEGW